MATVSSSASGAPASERPRARHSADLLGSGPGIDELVPALSFFGEKLARVLSPALASFSGGEPPVVHIGMPMDGTLGSISAEIEGLAAHALMTVGPKSLPFLATFEAAPVLRLVDRAFGGSGIVPDPLPEAFPMSAELLLSRLEAVIAAALGMALGGREEHRVRPVRRDTSLRQLDPFAMSEDVLQIVIEVEEAASDPWSLAITFPLPTLASVLIPQRHAVARRLRLGRPDPGEEPFASMPLPVTAVLVDMQLGFRRLAMLKPGDVLPVAVARAVPLQVAGRTVATGTVGEVDDRVAIQIQSAF